MTDAQIREIRERCEAAVNGPWRVQMHNEDYGQGYGETTYYVWQGDELLKIGIADGSDKAKRYWANAAFIASARQDIPAMLDEVERLRKENVAWSQINDAAVFGHNKLRAEMEAAKNTISALESDKINLEMNLEHTEAELEAAKRERNAAVHDLYKIADTIGICCCCDDAECASCTNSGGDTGYLWKWRGPVAENTSAPEMGAGDGEKEG